MSFSIRSILAIFAAIAFVTTTEAFGVVRPSVGHRTTTTTSLNIFGDALKGAFANEDKGPRENAGLKGGPNYNDNVTVNGKPVKAVVGQKVSVVAASARVKIAYNCKQGDCGTCMVKINGRNAKACQATIPSGRCAIQTIN